MFSLRIFQECLLFVLAFATGMIFFRRLNAFYRLILLQVFINIINYAASYIVTAYQNAHNLPQNNIWLFNIYTFIECSILTAAGYTYLKRLRSGVAALGGYALFIVTFIVHIATKSITEFANYAACLEGVLVLYMCLIILYQRFVSGDRSKATIADKCLCFGVILYFACTVPYLSLLNYLEKTNSVLNSTLYATIILVFQNIRYLLTAISFYLYGSRPLALKSNNE